MKIIWETAKIWAEAPAAVADSPRKRRRRPESEDSKSVSNQYCKMDLELLLELLILTKLFSKTTEKRRQEAGATRIKRKKKKSS